jgi:Flp pilus assembly pilin Flp
MINIHKFKRGEANVTAVALALIVAAIILAIIIYVLFIKTGAPLANTFKNIIPGFNQSTVKIKDIEIVRYDLVKAEVSFYDGENWIVLKDKADLNDKSFKLSEISSDFYKYFYDRTATNRPVVKYSTGYGRYFISAEDYEDSFNKIVFKRPVTYVDWFTLYNFDQEKYGIVIALDGSYYVTTAGIKSLDSFVRLAIQWRDSIFKGGSNPKAADIHYSVTEGKNTIPTTAKFCVEKKDQYMIVRLNQPVASDAECK